MSAASEPNGEERQKELVVNLFGEARNCGIFPSKLHTDLRHLIEMFRRSRQPRLAGDRLAALEKALASADSTFRSVGELRQQIEVWRENSRLAFDADRYYDGTRAEGYTEHNRGSQETLARRTLQLCSLSTEGATSQRNVSLEEHLLAVDLGCGSGLSTAVASRVASCTVGVIGVDLSSEMLRSEEWQDVQKLGGPLIGERLRCDLSQPLPFRSHVFDLAYSVSAVHYLAQDSTTRSAEQRISALTRTLRQCLVTENAKPCVLQAYLTRESKAVDKFAEVAMKDGWALCDLVVDQAHESPAERDFLYLLDSQQKSPAVSSRPPRCSLYKHAMASCALAMESWTKANGIPTVKLDGAHRAWMRREHDRYARRIVRLHKRCATDASLDHASPLGEDGKEEAERLQQVLKEAEELKSNSEEHWEEERMRMILEVLHS